MSERTVECPSCGRAEVAATVETFPFCSQRCRAADLGAWLQEAYRIAVPAWGPQQPAEDVPAEGFGPRSEPWLH